MRIRIDYEISIRCRLGRHDQGDAEHGCQGGFKPVLGVTRFCLCRCHHGPVASDPKPSYTDTFFDPSLVRDGRRR